MISSRIWMACMWPSVWLVNNCFTTRTTRTGRKNWNTPLTTCISLCMLDMDGLADRRTDRPMDRRTNGPTDGPTDRLTDWQIMAEVTKDIAVSPGCQDTTLSQVYPHPFVICRTTTWSVLVSFPKHYTGFQHQTSNSRVQHILTRRPSHPSLLLNFKRNFYYHFITC